MWPNFANCKIIYRKLLACSKTIKSRSIVPRHTRTTSGPQTVDLLPSNSGFVLVSIWSTVDREREKKTETGEALKQAWTLEIFPHHCCIPPHRLMGTTRRRKKKSSGWQVFAEWVTCGVGTYLQRLHNHNRLAGRPSRKQQEPFYDDCATSVSF